jgi:Ion channel
MQVGLWAFVFLLCGEFRDVRTAYYHSAVNFTTLGYGDVLLSPQWRLLGPLEAADGMLLFGVSTAMIFAIIMKLVQARYVEV